MKLMEKGEVLSKRVFDNIHNRILDVRFRMKQCLYDLCMAMKEMHNTKAYLVAGYNSFEEYTFDCFNIKKSQAYDYVKLADRYSSDFFDKHGDLGITKIQALNKLPKEAVEEFLTKYDTNSMSVKEIKKAVGSYLDKKDAISAESSVIEESEEDDADNLFIDIVESEIVINSFGDLIKSKRISKGYSIFGLAKIINCNTGSLYYMETGKRIPTPELLSKMIELLGLQTNLVNKLIDDYNVAKKKLPNDVLNYLLSNPDEIQEIRTKASGGPYVRV